MPHAFVADLILCDDDNKTKESTNNNNKETRHIRPRLSSSRVLFFSRALANNAAPSGPRLLSNYTQYKIIQTEHHGNNNETIPLR